MPMLPDASRYDAVPDAMRYDVTEEPMLSDTMLPDFFRKPMESDADASRCAPMFDVPDAGRTSFRL